MCVNANIIFTISIAEAQFEIRLFHIWDGYRTDIECQKIESSRVRKSSLLWNNLAMAQLQRIIVTQVVPDRDFNRVLNIRRYVNSFVEIQTIEISK